MESQEADKRRRGREGVRAGKGEQFLRKFRTAEGRNVESGRELESSSNHPQ